MSGREMFLFDPKMLSQEVRALRTDIQDSKKQNANKCLCQSDHTKQIRKFF